MLSQLAHEYMTLRQGLGFKLIDTEELLRSYVAFAKTRGDSFIRADTALEWAILGASVQRRYRRLRTIALFAEHLCAQDSRHEPIRNNPFPSTIRRHPPRIFSVEEISAVMVLADSLWPTDSIRPLTYRTVIGLLFSTGMRIGEALRLRLNDLAPDGLTINQTKFRKSRWLPLHESTLDALSEYLDARRQIRSDTDHVFLSWRRRRPLDREDVLRTFQKLCAQAGIVGAGSRGKPRLHDLRHSFAVHALRRCGANRDVVERHMLALSTYMGHVSVTSTYWYLEQTPELMRDIADACEVFTQRRTL